LKVAKRSDLLSDLQKVTQAYKIVFDQKSPFARTVIEDMVKFCRARDSEYHRDERLHAFLSGRRDVWLRIEQFTLDTPEAILDRISRPLEVSPETLNSKEK